MGRNKALLPGPQGEGTLLDLACDTAAQALKAAGCAEDAVFVSGNYPGYRFIEDEITGAGPLCGMHAALSRLGADCYGWILFLPVDMPGLDPQTLARLYLERNEESLGASFTESELPLMLKVSETTRHCVSQMLLDTSLGHSQRSVAGLISRLSMQRLSCSGQQRFANLNTAQDYSIWLGERP